MKRFVKASLSFYPVIGTETFIGLAVYGATVRVALQPRDASDRKTITGALRQIYPIGGSRNITNALSKMPDVFGLDPSRADAAKLVVLFTTGKNDDPSTTRLQEVSDKLRSQGIQVFVIAIGNEFSDQHLQLISMIIQGQIRVPGISSLPDIIGSLEIFSGLISGEHGFF